MTAPDLDELREDHDPFVATSIGDDSVRLHVALDGQPDEASGLRLRVTVAQQYAPAGAPPMVDVTVELDEDATERVYAISRVAMTNHLRGPDQAVARPELEPRLRLTDLPEPEPDPLVWLDNPRKRILDHRSRRGDLRLYVASRIVHRTDCSKLGTRAYGGPRTWSGDWADLLPEIADGRLIPVLCGLCKPLGPHTKQVNSMMEWKAFTAPEGVDVRAFIRFVAMDVSRWRALAELIAWAAADATADTADKEGM